MVNLPNYMRHFNTSSLICDPGCRYDFVEVEDISEISTLIRGRWCGHKEVPPRITSRTNQLKITFKSDDYFVAKPGFKIYYSLVVSACGLKQKVAFAMGCGSLEDR